MIALLWGCVPVDPEPTPDATDSDTPADSGLAVEDPVVDCTDVGPLALDDDATYPRAARTVEGSVTWTLRFDEEAQAQGFVDCQYTRTYDGAEAVDQGWLCPGCGLFANAAAVMTSGYDDCYLQIDDDEAERTEHIGLGTVDGALHFFRSGAENVSLGDLGAVDECAVAWEDEAELDDGGMLTLSASGGFVLGESAEELEDPQLPRTEAYACGWPLGNPGGPNASWTLALGEVFPNARLEDQCGEGVDIWDFWGSYLVIDASAVDCGPCQSMASEAEAFKASMAAQGVDVELVTLLAESLSAINRPADLATRESWVETFELGSPVLGDRGLGYALFPALLGEDSGMSFPSIVVVDRDMVVLHATSGFGDFTDIEAVILEDFAERE